MEKLQQLLDTAFGQRVAQRAPEEPSQYFLQQQQRLARQAEKIAALRKARLERRQESSGSV